jgi:reversibly glycosylated polypeptide/UDP-arabinopyranose mutase
MIAIVIPSIRKESLIKFTGAWIELVIKHNIEVVVITDGKKPKVFNGDIGLSIKEVMGEDSDLIYNFNDGVRNLGFAYIAKYMPHIDTIISLDDDVEPIGDPIQDHLNALNMKVPISWMSTASKYTRGMPYNRRLEAEVVLSHGVWKGVADWDAPTQLIKGNESVEFYKGVIPKGCLFPMCAMNFAFKRKLLPYIYQAPMFDGINRFADIWGGIEAKKDIDRKGWAVVTGYATVKHEKASNVFDNLVNEAKGLAMNETLWYNKIETKYDKYFNLFRKKRKQWQRFVARCER